MKKYNNFLNEIHSNKLHYYAYDWDDNILNMPTKIHLQQLVGGEFLDYDVSTSEFAEIRSNVSKNPKEGEFRMYDNDADKTFSDFIGHDIFLEDTKEALTKKLFGPAFRSFINTLVNGELFAIITARASEPETLRAAVDIIVYEYLSDNQQEQMIDNLSDFNDVFKTYDDDEIIDKYLDECEYIGVNSETFIKEFGDIVDISNPEEGKKLALSNFTKRVQDYGKQSNRQVKMGFSDDDKGNVESVKKHFNEINDLYDVDFYVFDTSDPKLKGGLKTKI